MTLNFTKSRIILAYIPHSNDTVYTTHLFSALSKQIIPTMNTIILGDFNMGNIDWEHEIFLNNYSNIQMWNFFSTNQPLTQIVTKPTRRTNILDLIFVTNPELYSNVDILPPVDDSDHNVLKLQSYIQNSTECRIIKFKNFYKAYYSKIAENLSNINWSFIN